jgi:ankyrin repeat protein
MCCSQLGKTALMLATDRGHAMIVKLLVEVNRNVRNTVSVCREVPRNQNLTPQFRVMQEGKTTLMLASEIGNARIVAQLTIEGAAVDALDRVSLETLL